MPTAAQCRLGIALETKAAPEVLCFKLGCLLVPTPCCEGEDHQSEPRTIFDSSIAPVYVYSLATCSLDKQHYRNHEGVSGFRVSGPASPRPSLTELLQVFPPGTYSPNPPPPPSPNPKPPSPKTPNHTPKFQTPSPKPPTPNPKPQTRNPKPLNPNPKP